MLDHVFLDAVSALSRALDDTLLHRERHEDRLTCDLLVGDLVWETSVTLPGEGNPSRVRADLTLDWPTWSQSAWRSWALGELLDEPPEIGIEVVFRLQRLANRPETGAVVAGVAAQEPPGTETFDQTGAVVEEDLDSGEVAIEVAFEGAYRLLDPQDAPRQGLFGPGGFASLGGSDPAETPSPAGPTPAGPTPAGPTPAGPAPAGPRPADVPISGTAGETAAAAQSADGPAGGLPGGGGDHPDRPGPGGDRQAVGAGGLATRRDSLSPQMAGNLVGLGRWVASTLVRLVDMDAEFLTAEDD
ncbi:MAG: hypothetical protein ACRDY0_01780 [Acidimicrobiales bacterium]